MIGVLHTHVSRKEHACMHPPTELYIKYELISSAREKTVASCCSVCVYILKIQTSAYTHIRMFLGENKYMHPPRELYIKYELIRSAGEKTVASCCSVCAYLLQIHTLVYIHIRMFWRSTYACIYAWTCIYAPTYRVVYKIRTDQQCKREDCRIVLFCCLCAADALCVYDKKTYYTAVFTPSLQDFVPHP